MSEHPSRGRPRHPALDDRILDATEALLGELSPDAVTMEAVAARAGVAKQTLYRRWPARSPLLMDVLARVAARAAPPVDTGGLVSDLQALLEPAFAFAGTLVGGSLMRALAAEALASPQATAAFRERFVDRRRAAIAQAVERARMRGEVEVGVDADLVCDTAYGPLWYRLLFGHAPVRADVGASLSLLIGRVARRAGG